MRRLLLALLVLSSAAARAEDCFTAATWTGTVVNGERVADDKPRLPGTICLDTTELGSGVMVTVKVNRQGTGAWMWAIFTDVDAQPGEGAYFVKLKDNGEGCMLDIVSKGPRPHVAVVCVDTYKHTFKLAGISFPAPTATAPKAPKSNSI